VTQAAGIPDQSSPPHSITVGFTVLLAFFTLLLSIELLSGEAWGVSAKKAKEPFKYWIVLICQATVGIVFVALLYFLTH
jgi:sterol desaturase/sphingolipid hydroxylase (fatty acid hydroxylase superfamily)